MRHDPHEGIADLNRHLDRMRASAEALGFRFDRHDARNELQAATFGSGECQVRLLLAASGAVAVEVRPLPDRPEEPVLVTLAAQPLGREDPRAGHRTSDTSGHQGLLAAAGTFELLFTDPSWFLTEGSFTTLFLERDGMLLTPPRVRALRGGVLRERLIEEGRAREAELRPADVADGFLIGNMVYGLLRARLV